MRTPMNFVCITPRVPYVLTLIDIIKIKDKNARDRWYKHDTRRTEIRINSFRCNVRHIQYICSTHSLALPFLL